MRVRELEEECAEKELQQIALKDRLERLDSTGSDLDLGLGSPKSSSPPSAMRRRTSTEKLIDSLQDSDDSDDAEDIMTFLKNPSAKKKKNGIVSPENEKRKTSKTETDDEKRANSAAAAAATTVSTPPAIGSLRDEFAALGENVESEYDSLSDESDNDDDDDGYEDAVLELLKDDETKSTKTAKKEDKTTTAEGKNGGGGVSVFVTKFDYNPNADSPNDNPETELSLKRGEFVYVYGDVDDVSEQKVQSGPIISFRTGSTKGRRKMVARVSCRRISSIGFPLIRRSLRRRRRRPTTVPCARVDKRFKN